MEQTYEEHRHFRQLWAWVVLLALCALILGWGFLTFKIVPDRGDDAALKRYWDYSALPDVPGQSQYSTNTSPPPQNAPQQVPTLPEAKVRKGATQP